MIQEFSLALAGEGKRARTIKIYTDAAAWLQRVRGLTDWSITTCPSGRLLIHVFPVQIPMHPDRNSNARDLPL